MKKYVLEFIKRNFEDEGYTLLSNKYINSDQKLKYICPQGHSHTIRARHWVRGIRCPYCDGQGKLTLEFVKDEFKKEKYILLATKYINARTKLNYICSKGHYNNIAWHHWKSGYRCPECAIINRCGKNHPQWKGGISAEPYCLIWKDKQYKEDIKKRDNYRCQNPDCWQTSNSLCIHHINYNKKECHPSNLITLCKSCNSRANKDREWHREWYKIMMEKRTNGK